MKARLAGKIFEGAKTLAGQTSRLLGIDEMDTMAKVMRFGPDAGFAVMNAVQTPGDLTDKLIAGTTDLVGSAGTGLVLAAPFKKHQGVATMLDMGGSYAGMFGGMAVSEAMQRGKDKMMGGQGLSAYERANVQYEEQFRQQIMQELSAAGLLRDDTTGMV